ncbi:DUF4278 domain-containing protein [Rhodobacter sp. NTK016B]|uniref:DUF4278 domain-containing protein n=1 Tax=Rhodobacter sp. NTK016B TaxID=2759676 RepID=UPI001A9006CB|nr:DUF4278 domain-containing protein [Rhodobacter sp. NTK016B]MBN8293355.1 DUF4278 domain-containing protein [Rhodobacter sp. NTK016B]
MTTLIYRGIEHDGQKPQTPTSPTPMIYRGIRFLSQRQTLKAAAPQTMMCYRGVSHSAGAALSQAAMPVLGALPA